MIDPLISGEHSEKRSEIKVVCKSHNVNGARSHSKTDEQLVAKAKETIKRIRGVINDTKRIIMAMQEVPFFTMISHMKKMADEKPYADIFIESEGGLIYIRNAENVVCGMGAHNIGNAIVDGQLVTRRELHGTLLIWSAALMWVNVDIPRYYLMGEFGRRSTPWIRLCDVESCESYIMVMSLHASVSRAKELVPHLLEEARKYVRWGQKVMLLGDFNMGPQSIIDLSQMTITSQSPRDFITVEGRSPRDISDGSEFESSESGGSSDSAYDSSGSAIRLPGSLILHVFPGFTHVDKNNEGKRYWIDHAITNFELRKLRIMGINQGKALCTLPGDHDHGIIRFKLFM